MKQPHLSCIVTLWFGQHMVVDFSIITVMLLVLSFPSDVCLLQIDKAFWNMWMIPGYAESPVWWFLLNLRCCLLLTGIANPWCLVALLGAIMVFLLFSRKVTLFTQFAVASYTPHGTLWMFSAVQCHFLWTSLHDLFIRVSISSAPLLFPFGENLTELVENMLREHWTHLILSPLGRSQRWHQSSKSLLWGGYSKGHKIEPGGHGHWQSFFWP